MESNQEVYQNGYCAAEFTPENAKNGDHFIIEDLLDLPNDESMAAADGGFESVMTDSAVTAVDTSCNSTFSAGSLADPHFQAADFGGPSGSAAGGQFSGELSVPVQSDISAVGKKSPKSAVQKKREGSDNSGGSEGRRCLHCATDKTPQWRTGPMGPKTLCNACGVRYKSGRLVPEYRPAASPTFVLTKHSNSHRKVLELRRQKELQRAQQQQQQLFLHHHHYQQNMMFDASNGEDYLIHQHIGPDFRQLI
ncbi:hypothetical protein CDL12_16750 [Handroanthus impetiginosus]|uniref:GATA-type domain-containing protein n=1 Tax=Handroanthus impetiginosus TaxID=429701 RepID=A0A2G9GZG1_9LAMI|nr:hypothetical protein CDL12_16750 [Handroanthus impetiginosus]